jgi:hypothetical protein
MLMIERFETRRAVRRRMSAIPALGVGIDAESR